MGLLKLIKHPVRLANAIIRPSGLMIVHRPTSADEDLLRFVTSESLHDRVVDELTSIAESFLSGHLSKATCGGSRPDVKAIVADFIEVNRRRPIRFNDGGSRFHNAFWLFVIARFLDAEQIIESGVWRGLGTWYLRQACPHADIQLFDISFDAVEYRDDVATYHESDWSKVQIMAKDPARSLCFFDDHQNQAMRVRQAYDRGFRLLLFDDTLPGHKLYADKWPPLPSVDMLMDDRIRDGDTLQWEIDGKPYSYTYRDSDCHGVRDLIQDYAHLPDVASAMKYARHSFLSFVRLRD